ncbi:hypothetical protein [Flaviflexus salsibiostraticola]|uniref:hypothetical protein n=1 Tax=Flaviflexus salsibiostraticola TaxID=1282737 RepID=UPI001FE4B8C0|nr:hypothetical protein [Flaviflexus salsibiostraticola]
MPLSTLCRSTEKGACWSALAASSVSCRGGFDVWTRTRAPLSTRAAAKDRSRNAAAARSGSQIREEIVTRGARSPPLLLWLTK